MRFSVESGSAGKQDVQQESSNWSESLMTPSGIRSDAQEGRAGWPPTRHANEQAQYICFRGRGE